jgi:hypothetical protein
MAIKKENRPTTKAMIVFAFLVTSLSFGSCKKEKDKTSVPNTVEATPKVYIAGVQAKSSFQANAILWVDGIAKKLSPDSTWTSFAYCVFVSDTDVFVGGMEGNKALQSRAVIWKNAQPIYLTDFESGITEVFSVFISGKDVYAIGLKAGKSKLWKNGSETDLTDIILSFYCPQSLYVNGSDIYITGSKRINPSSSKPILWKNGVITDLAESLGLTEYPSAVFVKNNNVYNSYGNLFSVFFKNNSKVNLVDTPQYVNVKSIFVTDNNDVYLGGSIKNDVFGNENAMIWKNGTISKLPQKQSYSISEVNSIFIYKDHVYGIGYEQNASSHPRFWKDGEDVAYASFSGTGMIGYSVFVK